MRTRSEITEIFSHLGKQLEAHREMGIEPPPLSDETLRYLEAAESGIDYIPVRKSYPPDGPPDQGRQPNALKALRSSIGECRRCKLHENRTRLVFGEGSSQAQLVFVGEGPGREEDKSGRPFVGEAGKLLTRIIENGMGLSRKDVYICNVVKCRPPRNRDPEKDEMETCIPFLEKQIDIIRPKVICSLGRVAAQCLIDSGFKISKERGAWQSYKEIPLMPTFHPAYLLRYPSAKQQVWDDIRKVMTRLGLEVKKNG